MEPTSKMSREVVAIQILRALAATLVVVYHTNIRFQIGAIGVDIFFAISGLVMILSTVSLRKKPNAALVFLRRRIVRIVPMYWLFTVLIIIIGVCESRVFTGGELVKSFLFIPFHIGGPAREIYYPVLSVGWTLAYEAFFYVSFAICLACRASPFILAPLFAFMSIYGILHPEQNRALLSLLNYRLLEFIVGMAIGWLFMRERVLPPIAAFVLCLCSVAAVLVFNTNNHWNHMCIWAPAAILLVYGSLSLEPLFASRRLPIIEVLANASYSIYLCHQDFTLRFINYLRGDASYYNSGLIWAMKACMCLLVGVVVHYAIERPILEFFAVRIGGRSPAQAV